MIKRTLYFGNPTYLSTSEEQLVINFPGTSGMEGLQNKVPIEDIGVIILDHKQITITHALIEKLLANNAALITCDSTHHPTGLMLNLQGNQLQSAKFRAQIDVTQPLKKQLWQQTVRAKIQNQANYLKQLGKHYENMNRWVDEVKSGDAENHEARAAVYYWKNVFDSDKFPDFKRDREGLAPNNLLNYGYAILRATMARSLVGSGLLPTLGIFHRNQYNAYCLADDIMEPYRPYVDHLVGTILENGEDYTTLNPSIKKQLLQIPVIDVVIEGERSPLMIGVQKTTASLAKCYEGKTRKILYPEL